MSVRRGGGRSFPSLLDDDTANSPVVSVQPLTLTPSVLLRFLPTFQPGMTEEMTNEVSVVDNWKEELELTTTRRHDKNCRSKGSDGD